MFSEDIREGEDKGMQKLSKVKIGVILGVIAGIIDVIPMILQKLTWDANLSAFLFWVVCGILISMSEIKTKGILKGIIISYLVLLPMAVIVGKQEPKSLIPMSIMTLILGSLLGWIIEKIK